MRSHAQIIADAGGPHRLARTLHPFLTIDEPTLQKRVRAWAVDPPSIPGEYWKLLSSLGIAQLDELAVAAARRKAIAIDRASDVCSELRFDHVAPGVSSPASETAAAAQVSLEKAGVAQ